MRSCPRKGEVDVHVNVSQPIEGPAGLLLFEKLSKLCNSRDYFVRRHVKASVIQHFQE